MSKGAIHDLNRRGDIFKLHDSCPDSEFNCQKQVMFTRIQYELNGAGFRNKLK